MISWINRILSVQLCVKVFQKLALIEQTINSSSVSVGPRESFWLAPLCNAAVRLLRGCAAAGITVQGFERSSLLRKGYA